MDKQKKKQLAADYTQSLRPMGIFQLLNKANGKRWIGSSMNVDKVWGRELFVLQMGSHRNAELQRDWKEFGEEQFEFEIVDMLKPEDPSDTRPETRRKYEEELELLERMWLDKLQPYGEQGYNKPPRG